MILKKITALLLILALIFSFVACSNGDGNDADSGEGAEILVKIGENRTITAEDLRQFLTISAILEGIDLSMYTEEYLQIMIGQMLLEELIDYEVLMEYYERKGVDPLPEDYQESQDTYLAEAKDALGDYINEIGLTEKGLTDYYKYQFYIQALTEEVMEEIDDLEALKQEYFAENPQTFAQGAQIDTAHILVKTQEEADALKAQLDEGADFAQLAMEHSIDGSAASGGELGPYAEGTLVEEYWNGAMALAPGEISDPIESQFGYHIIRLNSVTEGSMPAYEEVSEDVENYVMAQLYYSRIDELREEIGYEYMEADEDEDADLSEGEGTDDDADANADAENGEDEE